MWFTKAINAAVPVYLSVTGIMIIYPILHPRLDRSKYLLGYENDTDVNHFLNTLEKPSAWFFEERMADDVKFENSLLILKGKSEAFEMTKFFRPFTPLRMYYSGSEERWIKKFLVQQEYKLFWIEFTLESVIYLEYNEEHKICVIKEQLRDVPLLSNVFFRGIRRMNGRAIYRAAKLSNKSTLG